MNFNWLNEYNSVGGCPWSDEQFYKYGLTKDEVFYAWTLTHIRGKKTFAWVREMIAQNITRFGIEDSWITIDSGNVIVTDALSDDKYNCTLKQFVSDLEVWEQSNV